MIDNILNISLVGFMGSGKTTTGRILAEKLNFLFIDLDNIVELQQEMPVSVIFERYGEEYFRDLETAIVKKMYVNKNCVFACGGGVITRHENTAIIKKDSFVVFLHVSPTEVFKRLKNDDSRPLLKSTNRFEIIKGLMEKRDILYRSASDFTIETDFKTQKEIAGEILKRLKK